MSVLISGMKMPKEEALKVAIRDGIASVYLDEGKADYYSVIELPDHGDLIDRDELLKIKPWDWACDPYEVEPAKLTIAEQPVIIPAERSEDD